MNRPNDYAAFYGLLNRMHVPDREELKKSIVSQCTRGRTESLREMTLSEYRAALAAMTGLVSPTRQEQAQGDLRKRRSAVLHQMQLYGIDTSDWSRVNAFCRDARIAGKVFRELDGEELDALLVKLRAIRRRSAEAQAGNPFVIRANFSGRPAETRDRPQMIIDTNFFINLKK
jgi:hypothetical protein